jgi:hypothetical protein
MASVERGSSDAARERDGGPEADLRTEWQSALEGDASARARWKVCEGGDWKWQEGGVRLTHSGPEWSALVWKGRLADTYEGPGNFLIEVTVGGKAEAAGLSFGPYKDFLARIDSSGAPRHLQLEVDAQAGRWAFRVDGQLMGRCWWDSAVTSAEDLLNGPLTLKAKRVKEAQFRDLALHTFESSCRVSVIMTCYRFLQRLRLSLRNWCHQDLPSGAHELLVVNPQSPDGTHEHLAAVSRSYPHVRVREIPASPHHVTNKGAMINKALAESRGEWVWLTDADCLFASDSVATVLKQIDGESGHLFYGKRHYLTAGQTDALLVGRLDGLRDFADLAKSAAARAPENAPWGYTQIVHRSVFEKVRYREEVNHFAHTDGMFVEDCKKHAITPKQVDGLFCLHLDHPFSWYGTNTFL